MPQIRCARCPPVIRRRCHVICLRVAFFHVIMCISFCIRVRLMHLSILSVLSPDTPARTRGMSEILFYKWPENVLGMG